jgi:hypothetical protein
MLVGNEDNKMYDNIPLVSYTRKHICLYKTSATELEQEPIIWNPSAYSTMTGVFGPCPLAVHFLVNND